MYKNIVFWQNMPAHHQLGALRYLARVWEGDVYAVFDTRMLPDRKALGWKCPDFGEIKVHFLDEMDFPEVFVKKHIELHYDAIHVLGGIRGCLSVDLAWKEIKKNKSIKLACIAERPNFNSWKSIIQKAWYRNFFRKYGDRFNLFLTMGKIGLESYQKLGVSSDILFPYMYQADCMEYPSLSSRDVGFRSIRFVYIGRLIAIKGVGTLLDVLDSLPNTGWELSWIGGGGEYEKNVREISQSKEQVFFLGKVSSDEIINRLSLFDIAIVPSHYDGWGMVVNEAIMAGLGVIVTQNVGSKDLIEASQAGQVIDAGSFQSLKNVMNKLIDEPSLMEEWKENAEKYRPLIRPERVGEYLRDVLHYSFIDSSVQRPQPDWLVPNKKR